MIITLKGADFSKNNIGNLYRFYDPSLWVRQNMNTSGAPIYPDGNSSYKQSNIMLQTNITEPLTLTRKSKDLTVAICRYNADNSWNQRGTWTNLNSDNPTITFHNDGNPFNIIICTTESPSNYTIEEMLSFCVFS